MNTFMSHGIYPFDIDYLSGNMLTPDDAILLYGGDVTITTLDKPTFIFNYTPTIHFNIANPPTHKSWVFGIYLVEQLRPTIQEDMKAMLNKMQWVKDHIRATYGIETHLVVLTNFEQNKQMLEAGIVNSPVQFQSFFLPYQFRADEYQQLHQLFATTPKEYDVGFVGGLSERRKYSIRLCEEEGLRVNVIQKFGQERDLETAKCKLLMVSHYYDNINMYTNIRCDRIIFQNIPVLSESCSDENLLDIKDFVTFAPIQEIGKRAKEMLASPPSPPTEEQKIAIATSRRQHLEKVKATLLAMMDA